MGKAPRLALDSLSLVLPMYNERENIVDALDQARAVLPTLGFRRYEILIVDDGSKDDSVAVVEAWAKQHRMGDRLRLVKHPRNLGYGRALKTGFHSASSELVFYTDSDLPVDLAELARALPLLDGADMVIGYRLNRQDTLRRKIYSNGYNGLMRLLFDVHVKDVNFSFKLMPGDWLRKTQLSSQSVFIDGELLAQARKSGLTIAEMPVTYVPRKHGVSNFDSPKAAWATLKEMVAYRIHGPAEGPRQFIFNADDFGWTDGHNRAVEMAHAEGVLDRASLMANGDAFADAVAVAKRNPRLGIGVHLALLEGTPLLPASESGPLVESNGRFHDGLAGLGYALLRPGAIDAVRREWRAQIARVVDAGLPLSHLDSHKHVHMLPALLDVVIELAQEFGVPYVRLPRPSLSRDSLRRRAPAVAALWPLAVRGARRLEAAGLRFADHFIGFDQSGQMEASALRSALARSPEGTIEVMMHPAALTDGLRELHQRYHWARHYRFADELAALCDPSVREIAGRS